MKSSAILLDRDDMSDFERELFLKDLQRVNDEYFECDKSPALEITRTEEGFLVCVIFPVRRIKSLKHPI
ncbi:MAG: hypothetical protein K2O89_06225 [Clostridia bacterium]|nr:hypothetical protein [Clostridia bacterium]